MQLSEKTYCGEATETLIPALGALRIRVFYDFPYLYEGSQQYEENYLQVYANCPQSIVFGVFDGEQLIGATTGMPLAEEDPDIQKPFLDSGENPADYFYFGESILLPEYRGLGLGHRFFDIREQHARNLGFKHTVFCSVVREENHPLKPENYRSNDAFWIKRGYTRLPEIRCEMTWLDRGEQEETVKELIFWKKTWK